MFPIFLTILKFCTDQRLFYQDFSEWYLDICTTLFSSLSCRCNEHAVLNGDKYFYLVNWGECYGSPDYPTVGRQSELACISHFFAQCKDSSNKECIGNQYSQYVYEVGMLNIINFNSNISCFPQSLKPAIVTTRKYSGPPAPIVPLGLQKGGSVFHHSATSLLNRESVEQYTVAVLETPGVNNLDLKKSDVVYTLFAFCHFAGPI